MDKYAFSCMTWDGAPKAVREAQGLMEHMGRSYGEDQGLVIDRLTILGWVSSGTRRVRLSSFWCFIDEMAYVKLDEREDRFKERDGSDAVLGERCNFNNYAEMGDGARTGGRVGGVGTEPCAALDG